MSWPGIGVMIQMMGGDRGADAVRAVIGCKLSALAIINDSLRLDFADGRAIELFDDGQSCCERRWMESQSDLAYYVGATLTDVEIGESSSSGDDDVEETQFLRVMTDRGVITIANYNRHNGYYGGFYLKARAVQP